MATAAGVPGPGKQRARGIAARFWEPVARLLLRCRISPDAVTIGGTVAGVAASLILFPNGYLVAGALVMAVLACSDMLDGTMARLAGRSSAWGAFLDSSLDRITDAAVLAGLALWFLGEGDDPVLGALALYGLIAGFLVSYVRARAEGLGLKAAGGVAERTERMVLILLTTLLVGLEVPYAGAIGFWLLAIGATVTVLQRMIAVRRQTR